MERFEANFQEKSIKKTHTLIICAQICLRIVATATAFAATWTMVTAKQTVMVFGFQFDAQYKYSPALEFFAFANAIACGCTLLSLVFVFYFVRDGFTPINFLLLFVHDLFMMSLVLSSVAAGTAVGYVGRYGNSHAGWLKICDRLNKYCDKVTISLALSYLSVVCLVVLTVISALKSRQIKV